MYVYVIYLANEKKEDNELLMERIKEKWIQNNRTQSCFQVNENLIFIAQRHQQKLNEINDKFIYEEDLKNISNRKNFFIQELANYTGCLKRSLWEWIDKVRNTW